MAEAEHMSQETRIQDKLFILKTKARSYIWNTRPTKLDDKKLL